MPINHITADDLVRFAANPSMDSYQEIAGQSAIYPGRDTALGLWYCITKLNGEAGEAAEAIGKAFRDDNLISGPDDEMMLCCIGRLEEHRRQALIKELGDVLWYTARALDELGVTFSKAALVNLEKLASRSARGKLQGSGDER